MASRSLQLRADTVVEGAPDDVHALVADVAARPDWLSELQLVEPADPPPPGQPSFVGHASLLLHDFVGRADVRRNEPGRLLEEDIVLGARIRSTWLFEPAGTTTRVAHTLVIDFPGGPLGRIERWVLGWRMARLQRRSLERLAARVGQVRRP